MIPRADIVQWREFAPWISDAQVEQDLVISRLLVEFYQDKLIREKLLFRGGTALHKIHLSPAVRYSEDLDFIQEGRGGHRRRPKRRKNGLPAAFREAADAPERG